ncbi:MAG: pyrroline-5-carboxylate reductase [Oscillospiraceae bacterium]|nr:pyrroline-5-carboxylate reductase [Oscillospiraceae bacterium]
MNYGFIGLGNMAGAILRGMKKSGNYEDCAVYGFNRSPGKTEALADSIGLIPVESAYEAAYKADVIVLGVKPQMLDEVLPLIKDAYTADKLVVTMAAGKTLQYYADHLGSDAAVVRVMPNINAKVGLSVTSLCGNENVTDEQLEIAKTMLDSIGATYLLPEKFFAAFSAVSGASVAYTCMYIDSLAKGGVKAGLTKTQALEIAALATLGTAQLINDTGEHPLAIIDQVASPGGNTIEGILALQENGFESAVHKAVQAAIEKDKKL